MSKLVFNGCEWVAQTTAPRPGGKSSTVRPSNTEVVPPAPALQVADLKLQLAERARQVDDLEAQLAAHNARLDERTRQVDQLLWQLEAFKKTALDVAVVDTAPAPDLAPRVKELEEQLAARDRQIAEFSAPAPKRGRDGNRNR